MAKKANGATVLALADLDGLTDQGDVEDVDDTPPPKSLAQTIEDGGTYLEILEAQRREMTTAVLTVGGPAKAAMYRQIALLSKDIEAQRIDKQQQEDEDADTDGEAADEPLDPEAI